MHMDHHTCTPAQAHSTGNSGTAGSLEGRTRSAGLGASFAAARCQGSKLSTTPAMAPASSGDMKRMYSFTLAGSLGPPVATRDRVADVTACRSATACIHACMHPPSKALGTVWTLFAAHHPFLAPTIVACSLCLCMNSCQVFLPKWMSYLDMQADSCE
jgi:hypothetical protein